jgi:N-glycosylase/DNA lyase
MVQNLCLHYGVYINHIDNIPYHDFPTPQALSQDGVEEKLKELGFGYRAKYIAKTASMVNEKGIAWLEGLCNPESPGFGVVEAKDGAAGELVDGGREGYRRALQDLQILSGVGPKVADCVCLFGLGWGEAVPVDTHGMFHLFFSCQIQLQTAMQIVLFALCPLETPLSVSFEP